MARMSLRKLFSYRQDWDTLAEEQRMRAAEDTIRGASCLWRHYHINEVVRAVEGGTGYRFSEDEVVRMVQRIRNEHGAGPIAYYHLPGYSEEE